MVFFYMFCLDINYVFTLESLRRQNTCSTYPDNLAVLTAPLEDSNMTCSLNSTLLGLLYVTLLLCKNLSPVKGKAAEVKRGN